MHYFLHAEYLLDEKKRISCQLRLGRLHCQQDQVAQSPEHVVHLVRELLVDAAQVGQRDEGRLPVFASAGALSAALEELLHIHLYKLHRVRQLGVLQSGKLVIRC